jgi:hypothetical protein
MTSLFFLITIAFLFHEIGTAINPSKSVKWLKKLKDKEYFKSPEIETSEKLGGCWFATGQMLYFFWCILGLAFATQGISFALLFVIGIFAGLVQKGFSKKGWEESRLALFMRRVDSIICSVILLDIFMCHFRSDFWGNGIVGAIFGL